MYVQEKYQSLQVHLPRDWEGQMMEWDMFVLFLKSFLLFAMGHFLLFQYKLLANQWDISKSNATMSQGPHSFPMPA